jgi:site-specific recombinase XerD
MLRHACGFKLANDGVDTRALQHFLGHRNTLLGGAELAVPVIWF